MFSLQAYLDSQISSLTAVAHHSVCSSSTYPAAMDQPLGEDASLLQLKLAKEQTFLSPTCRSNVLTICHRGDKQWNVRESLSKLIFAVTHLRATGVRSCTRQSLMVLSLVDNNILLPQDVLHHLTLLIFSSISSDFR